MARPKLEEDFLEMGYNARFVVGTVGYSPQGHAWVTFEKGGKHFLLEPQERYLGLRLPRLDALRYKPSVSAEWDGKKAHFFQHEKREFTPPVMQIPSLALEWAFYRLQYFFLLLYWLSVGLAKLPYRMLRNIIRPRNHRM